MHVRSICGSSLITTEFPDTISHRAGNTAYYFQRQELLGILLCQQLACLARKYVSRDECTTPRKLKYCTSSKGGIECREGVAKSSCLLWSTGSETSPIVHRYRPMMRCPSTGAHPGHGTQDALITEIRLLKALSYVQHEGEAKSRYHFLHKFWYLCTIIFGHVEQGN